MTISMFPMWDKKKVMEFHMFVRTAATLVLTAFSPRAIPASGPVRVRPTPRMMAQSMNAGTRSRTTKYFRGLDEGDP